MGQYILLTKPVEITDFILSICTALAESIKHVGDVARAQGHWEEARGAYQEGLEIAERLASALPRSPDYGRLPEHFRARLARLRGSGGR